MNDHHIYIDTSGKERVLNFNQIRDAVEANHRIALIKEYRHITGKGLKDSKDDVEHAMIGGTDSVIDLFKEKLGIGDPYSKEEFMALVENAIDNMESLYFDDMLEAVMVTLENVKRKGGLEVLARERDRFLNKI